MINRELAKAIENYVVALKNHVDGNGISFNDLKKAEHKLTLGVLKYESTMDDITQMFADLRDYWDTLEVGK